MKISIVQMNMKFADPDYNFIHAENLIKRASLEKPDVIMLPETWNTGFFPSENLAGLSDTDGAKTKALVSRLARETHTNIIAGSVSNQRDNKIFNTAFVFDREGQCLGSYDKIHLFSPMGEDKAYEKGNYLLTFDFDGHRCGIMICYDIRFPELARALALKDIEILFVVAQWPGIRQYHWQTLLRARAIENQLFLAACNSCGTAGETVYGGCSCLLDPWGDVIKEAGKGEEIITGEFDFSVLKDIRSSINVFNDRRPELYKKF